MEKLNKDQSKKKVGRPKKDKQINDISKNIVLDKPKEKKSLIVNLME
jgi:hypothetical protein